MFVRSLLSRLSPAQTIAASTLAVLVLGTALLNIPLMLRPGPDPTLVDAAFTAVSALCVTGLATVDTVSVWSPYGMTVIAVLIQVGGLGVMTLATLLGSLTARRLGLRTRRAIEVSNNVTLRETKQVTLRITAISLSVEAAVAAVLMARFMLADGLPWPTALGRAVFLAVSAFNNAGFAVESSSLMTEANDPFVLVPIMVAIVLGGLGFPVIMELLRRYRLPKRWSVHTKMVVVATPVLIVGGALGTWLLEHANPGTLAGQSVSEQVLSSFFHSVSSRTAGFNSVDVGAMLPQTWLMTSILMAIGGSPAGTAGGMKITTVFVLLLIMWSEVRGDPFVMAFGKRLSRAVHRQVITVLGLMSLLMLVATFTVTVLEPFSLDEVLFEVVSATSTTGLSTGITADLATTSKVVLMVLMFVGRVGPITLGTALALRTRPILYEPAKERPIIG